MSETLSLCFLLRYFTVGGLERMVSALANSLVARGHNVRIVVLSSGKRNALITELDPNIDLVLLEGLWHRKIVELRRLTAGRLVHIHFGDGYTHSLIRAVLAGRTIVVTYHSVYSHKRTWLSNRIDQFWASQATTIVTVSKAVSEFCAVEVGIPASRIVEIPNAVPPPDTRFESLRHQFWDENAEAPVFHLISLASLYPHKNQQTLIRGLSMACRQELPLRLSVVGDGPMMAPLYRLALELGVQPDIEWYGAIWRRDLVHPLLASAQTFVSSSRFEGLPLSVLEAMSFGLPLVLSDIPPHRQLAGRDALYFSPDCPEELAKHLETLASNPQLCMELSAASRQRSRQFDLETCVGGYVDIYQKAVGI